jgi:DNA-binding transcriptional MerR regulator
MLTISQLAAYAGVTVRAVRHYHAKGLLPEPERDPSGYRRYDAAAVVELIRIRTLADAGVPLSRVHELLAADEAEFAAAIEEIDRRLRAEIRERQRHRKRVAQLAAGDRLALPPEAIEYLDRLRQLDVPERAIEIERDAWILVAAQSPGQMPALMTLKLGQIDDPAVTAMYVDLVEAADWDADDPRLPALAGRLVSLFEEDAKHWSEDEVAAFTLDDELANLLDEVFINAVPSARTLLRLLEERGWRGWTQLERIGPPSQPSTDGELTTGSHALGRRATRAHSITRSDERNRAI